MAKQVKVHEGTCLGNAFQGVPIVDSSFDVAHDGIGHVAAPALNGLKNLERQAFLSSWVD